MGHARTPLPLSLPHWRRAGRYGMSPKILDEPVIKSIAQRVHKTPAQVALTWAVQRGTTFLTTSTKPGNIQANFEISAHLETPCGRFGRASRRTSGSTQW
jgi:diketogulonate reductase-like aldo/keto reductase